jgi:hypothetical protein
MRADFASCPQLFAYKWIHRRAPQGTNIHLHAGACFARGLEATRKAYYGRGLSADDAIALGWATIASSWGDVSQEWADEPTKSMARVQDGLIAYFQRFPLESDYLQPLILPGGRPAVECDFTLPIPGMLHPETGEPLLYTGRFDFISKHSSMICGVDEKTTKQLGAKWGEKWTMRSQFSGYVWAAQQLGIDMQMFCVRGIAFLKNQYTFAEQFTPRPQWMLERWLLQLQRDVARMIYCWESGFWDQNLHDTCASYSGCPFLLPCSSQMAESFLETHFEENAWDPAGLNRLPAMAAVAA